MMSDILIYGAGGQAKSVVDVAEKSNKYNIAGLIDDTKNDPSSILGYPVYNDIRILYRKGIKRGLVAIGDNAERYHIVEDILSKYPDFSFVTLIHPSVQLAQDVSVQEGTVIMAGCCIKPTVVIGRHCIINANSTIGHDIMIGNFASLGPGGILGGHVVVGSFTAIGLGASVIHNIRIGESTVVGAGSTVVKDIPSNVVAYGTPCVVVRSREFDTPYL